MKKSLIATGVVMAMSCGAMAEVTIAQSTNRSIEGSKQSASGIGQISANAVQSVSDYAVSTVTSIYDMAETSVVYIIHTPSAEMVGDASASTEYVFDQSLNVLKDPSTAIKNSTGASVAIADGSSNQTKKQAKDYYGEGTNNAIEGGSEVVRAAGDSVLFVWDGSKVVVTTVADYAEIASGKVSEAGNYLVRDLSYDSLRTSSNDVAKSADEVSKLELANAIRTILTMPLNLFNAAGSGLQYKENN